MSLFKSIADAYRADGDIRSAIEKLCKENPEYTISSYRSREFWEDRDAPPSVYQVELSKVAPTPYVDGTTPGLDTVIDQHRHMWVLDPVEPGLYRCSVCKITNKCTSDRYSHEHVWVLNPWVRGQYVCAACKTPKVNWQQYPNPEPLKAPKKLKPGDVVEVNLPERPDHSDPWGKKVLPADPNHGREGPIVSIPQRGEAEAAEVWFEDGRQVYPKNALKPTGREQDISKLPPESQPVKMVNSIKKEAGRRYARHHTK